MTKAGTYGGTLTAKPQGDKLRTLRKALKLKQGEVESTTGVSHGQLTRYENGHPASIHDLIKLAEFYGVDPKELVSRDGLQSTSPVLMNLARLHGVRIEWKPNGRGAVAPPTQENT